MKVICSHCRAPTYVEHQPAPGAIVLAKCDACRRKEEKANRLALAAYYEGQGVYGGAGHLAARNDQ